MADQKSVQSSNKPTKKGYGKRPIWQYIVLYLIVAAVVYFAVYFIFFRHTGVSGSTGTFGY